VGKTSILKSYLENKFDKSETPTVGIEIKNSNIELKKAHF
jgi:GTPase SAR1 family protein